jgi:hypothetical protein
MTTNATLTIKDDSQTINIPVTWTNDYFDEGEDLYCDIFMEEKYPINFDDVEMTVSLDDDSKVTSQVRWDDMANLVYPARKRKK